MRRDFFRSCRAFIYVATVVCLTNVVPLPQTATARSGHVDLRTDPAFAAKGALGVASAGDVNGDGVGDALLTDCGANAQAGVTYVVFGPFVPGRFHVSDPAELESAERGFRIHGNQPNEPDGHVGDHACHPSPAGDVNGDGLDDVIVGAHLADVGPYSSAGRSYVVFGKTSTDPVSLADFDNDTQGMQGFRIDGGGERHLSGRTVAGLGDVNGDGLDDIAVGAPFAPSVYVIFGKADSLSINLALLETGAPAAIGFRIDTPSPEFDAYLEVGGKGDVNDDGLNDVVIGYSDSKHRRPAAFVVFGKEDSAPVDARRLEGDGFAILGRRDTATGDGVAIVGDVNRDGHDDLAVGAPAWSQFRSRDGASVAVSRGAVFVVFGKSGTRDVVLTRLGRRGYAIRGANRDYFDATGEAVAGVGDINDDGRADIIIGAHRASFNDRPGSGSAYVTFGKSNKRTIRLRRLGEHGYRIDGPRKHRFIGASVAGVGNVIGNKRPDVFIGGGTGNSLVGYVVPGRGGRN